jgi:hypothetical protein
MVELLFLPVGAGPTTGAEQAVEVVAPLAPRWVVPMLAVVPAAP